MFNYHDFARTVWYALYTTESPEVFFGLGPAT